MSNMTIGKRTFLGFGFLCVLCAGISLYAINRLVDVKQLVSGITTDSVPGLIAVGRITSGVGENQLRLVRLLSAETPEAQRKLQDELTAITAGVTDAYHAYEATMVLEEDKRLFRALELTRAEFLRSREQYLALVATNKAAAAAHMDGPMRPCYDAYSAAAKAVADFNARTASDNAKTLNAHIAAAVWWLTGVGIAGVCVGLIAAVFVVRGTTRVLARVSATLGEGASQVASAAAQVSSSSQGLAEGASQQAASLEETSSAIEEMASMTKRNAENADKANAFAREARVAADSGAEDIRQMNAAMDAIKVSSNDIAKIIKTIDEIAFQTNILALNAAVEAARAGEAGMGFAVVADEVRNLAQRCAESARETSAKIEGALVKTAQGVDLSAKVTQRLEEIQAKVRQVDGLVAEVASASKEQSQGIMQVNTAVVQMDKVTQGNAAGAEESASAAEELHAQAQSMTSAVTELLALVGASSQTKVPARTTHSAASRVATAARQNEPRPDSLFQSVSSKRQPQKEARTVERAIPSTRHVGKLSNVSTAEFQDF